MIEREVVAQIQYLRFDKIRLNLSWCGKIDMCNMSGFVINCMQVDKSPRNLGVPASLRKLPRMSQPELAKLPV